MNDDTMKFVEKRCFHLLGISGNRIQGNIDVTIHTCARGIIKGDNVSKVVVLKEFTIDSKDFFVVAEDVVEFTYRVAVLGCGTLNPLFDFVKVNGRHGGVISVESNHICVL